MYLVSKRERKSGKKKREKEEGERKKFEFLSWWSSVPTSFYFK